MPSQCVAWNCATRRRGDDSDDQTVTFHSFPVNRPEMLAQWLENMGETAWKPQRGSVLCSKHFDKDVFLQNYATPRLKPGAVPVYFEKRPNPEVLVDLDRRVNDDSMDVSVAESSGGGGKRPRRRKVLRRYDPEEEILNLRQMLDDERAKRKELEQEIYRLRQEKSEMSAKMNKLEASKCKPNIPQSLIPIIVDAMAKGVDPLKKPEPKSTKKMPMRSSGLPSSSLSTLHHPSSSSATNTMTTVAANIQSFASVAASATGHEGLQLTPVKVGASQTISPAPSTPQSAQKLVLQLPQHVLASNGQSVSFLVPVSSQSGTTTITDSPPKSADNEVVMIE